MACVEAIQYQARRIAERLGRQSSVITALRPAYEAFLGAASGGHGIPWRINAELFRIDPAQRHRMAHDYEASAAGIILKRLRPGMTAVDVGANVGVYALQMARAVGPGGRVIAFEPNPAARALLQKHMKLNRFETVTIVAAALGSTPGEASFFADGADGMSRLGAPNPTVAEARQFHVAIETLDCFLSLDGAKPDVVLIDVEGFEADVLDGARRTVLDFHGAISWFVEMHPDAWGWGGSDPNKMEVLLEELKLTPIPLSGQFDPMKDHGMVELVPSG